VHQANPDRVDDGSDALLQAAPAAFDGIARPSLAAAGALRRLCARLFDMWSTTVLIALPVGLGLALLPESQRESMATTLGEQITGVLCLVLGLVLDAALLARFGTTPGKAMLGVRVEAADGQPLVLRQALRRNVHMWWAGMALTIPLLNLFTMGRQGWRLASDRPASYDQGRYRVLALPLGWNRWPTFLVIAFMLLLIVGALLRNKPGPGAAAPIAAGTASISWTNPDTGRITNLAPGWSHDIVYNDANRPVHRFVLDGERAAVLLSFEPIGPTPLDVYARTVRQSMQDELKLDGRFEDYLGHPSWAAENFLDDAAVTRVEVRVLRHDGSYWRMVALQDYPYRDSDAATTGLRAQLWANVTRQ